MIPIIDTALNVAGKVLDHWFPPSMSEADKAKAKAEIQAGMQAAMLQDQEIRASIVRLEAQGNWLQRSWRPILMLSIVAIVVNNGILCPVLKSLGLPIVPMELTSELWTVLQVGLGGYVVGRSGEKIMQTYQDAQIRKERAKTGVLPTPGPPRF